jgi:hypothetical protein
MKPTFPEPFVKRVNYHSLLPSDVCMFVLVLKRLSLKIFHLNVGASGAWVEKFVLNKNSCLWHYMTSVEILFQLHGKETFGGNF